MDKGASEILGFRVEVEALLSQVMFFRSVNLFVTPHQHHPRFQEINDLPN